MKSKYLFIAMLFGVALSTVACNKCVTCSTSSSTDIEICKSDYKAIPGAYKAQVSNLESAGYTCK